MLSLDNSYNSEDLIDFDRKARELTGLKKIEYCVEPKFDGGSISLIYENDLLVRGATRGDGVEGDEVTTNIKQIRSIPLSAKFSEYGLQQMEIRGEVLINKNNFAKYNEQLIEQGIASIGQSPECGSRNIANQRSNRSSQKKPGSICLSCQLLFTGQREKNPSEHLTTHSGSLEMLWELGFGALKKKRKFLKELMR